MRLRPLSEAECYSRCYGGRRGDRVSLIRIVASKEQREADALRRLIAAGIGLEGAADHGVSQSLYLRDPDGNGVELYCDRPRQEWPHTPDGKLAMYTRHLDLRALLAELPADKANDVPTTRDL